jgi:hypothetical protein
LVEIGKTSHAIPCDLWGIWPIIHPHRKHDALHCIVHHRKQETFDKHLFDFSINKTLKPMQVCGSKKSCSTASNDYHIVHRDKGVQDSGRKIGKYRAKIT